MYICTHKLESEFLGRVSTTSGADDTTLTAESEEELKSLLMRVKSWLKTHHSKNEDCGLEFHHFMANRWGKSGNSDRFFSWAPKPLWTMTISMKLKDARSLKEKL